MLRFVLGVIAFFGVITSSMATVIEMPLIYDGREYGRVHVELERGQLRGVSARDLANALQNRISSELRTQLANTDLMTIEELARLGIRSQINPRTIELEIILDARALGTNVISFDRTQADDARSIANASWQVFSNFSGFSEYEVQTDNRLTNIDWVGSANIGGIQGVNARWSANLIERSAIDGVDIRRGDFVLFHDRPSHPVRFSLGDVSSTTSGHLSTVSLGGFSFESLYSELQPTRRISPGVNQEIVMLESGEIIVFVNGLQLGQFRLGAGRYNLSDLPLGQGSNDIEVLITYNTGETDVQRFSQFYNAQLLSPRLTQYGASIGYPSEYDFSRGIIYDEENPIVTAYVERGVSSYFTLGANAQYAESAQVYGLTATMGTPIGNVSLRYSQVDYADENNPTGDALSVEWQQRVFGADEFGSPNLRVSYEEFDNFNPNSWQFFGVRSGRRVLANYNAYFRDGWFGTLSAVDDRTIGSLSRRTVEARTFYRWRNFRFGAGARETLFFANAERDRTVFFTFDYQLFNSRSGHRFRTSTNSLADRTSIEFGRISRDVVHNRSYQLTGVRIGESDQVLGRFDYVLNRARVGAYADYTSTPFGDNEVVGVRGNTSLALVDGHFGWGRATPGPVVVVKPHRTLSQSRVHVNPSSDGVQAFGTRRMGALVSSGQRHGVGGVQVDVPDAPVGYDFGPGQYAIRSGAQTAVYIEVGSDNSYTIIGQLVDDAGEPLSLQAGHIHGEDYRTTLFTNSAGRFVAERLSPGTYVIQLIQRPEVSYRFDVPASDSSLIRIGVLRPTGQLNYEH
ncbi:MAG: hypothetical protein JJU10_05385 [Idiomarina sp.]|nr:hypothetical protein [Idiomarina sp.]